MKLSDIKGDRAIDVIADLIDPIAEISMDPNTSALFKREKAENMEEGKKILIKRIRKLLPVLMRDHKERIITILSTIEGVSPEEYVGCLNMVKLVKGLFDLFTDECILELFTSAQTGDSSGSAPENIEVPEA